MNQNKSDIYGAPGKVTGLGFGLTQFSILTIILQSITTGLIILSIILLFSHDLSSSYQEETIHTAQQLVKHTNMFIRHYSDVIKHIAQQKTIIAYYNGNKKKALKKLATIMESNDPGILKIRFLQMGVFKRDESEIPHLGYAGLEMLRKASENKQFLIAEIHSPKSPNEQLAFVHQIEADGKLMGLVHISVSLHILKKLTENAEITRGLVEVQQKLDDGSHIKVVTAGDSGLSHTSAEILNIIGAQLQVAYWTGSISGLLFSPTLLKYWFALVLIVILIAVIQILITKRVTSLLRDDQVTILTFFGDFTRGKLKSQYSPKLRDFRGTLEALYKQTKGANVTASGDQEAETSEEDDDDDALDAVLRDPFPGEEGFGVEESSQLIPQRRGQVVEVPDQIFLAYDIRGIVDSELTSEVAYTLGLGIGSEALHRGENTLIVGRDGRLSSHDLANALMLGLEDTGCDVIDIGLAPTPVVYFATHVLDSQSGVVVTGSHNPAQYNGFKITLQGESLSDDEIQAIKIRIRENKLASGQGMRQEQALGPEYISQVIEDVHLGRPMKVVLDCGHGVGADIAPMLLKTLGADVIELNCEVDGRFPGHHPDPSRPENMVELQAKVKEEEADLGVALDGDADRIGVVDSAGNIIWPDRLMMLYAMDILIRQPGADVIYDVKCTRNLAKEIVKFGGRPIMWKTGHSMIKAKIKETGAALGGDFTGHIFINERWYGFDDALYAACRLLEVLSADFRSSQEVFADFPNSLNTPELTIKTAIGENYDVMEKMASQASFPGGKITDLDGLRVDFETGWGLIRASNTMPSIVVRFEGDDEHSIKKMHTLFNNVLRGIAPNLEIPMPEFGDAQEPGGLSFDDDFGLSLE